MGGSVAPCPHAALAAAAFVADSLWETLGVDPAFDGGRCEAGSNVGRSQGKGPPENP